MQSTRLAFLNKAPMQKKACIEPQVKTHLKLINQLQARKWQARILLKFQGSPVGIIHWARADIPTAYPDVVAGRNCSESLRNIIEAVPG